MFDVFWGVGICNYMIFCDDSWMFGYFEVDDFVEVGC